LFDLFFFGFVFESGTKVGQCPGQWCGNQNRGFCFIHVSTVRHIVDRPIGYIYYVGFDNNALSKENLCGNFTFVTSNIPPKYFVERLSRILIFFPLKKIIFSEHANWTKRLD
jgi:hypothetical protein